jgi:hypothetical protein
MFVSYLCAYQNKGKTFKMMTIYLRMLSLSLEYDDTIWRRVDDSWWFFPFLFEVFLIRLVSYLELFMNFLSRLHPFFLILLLCHLSALWSFDTLLDLPPHSLFYAVLSSAFFMQSYWSLSYVFLHPRFKFILWLTQIELRVSCRG